MFTDKELTQAYNWALGSDDLDGMMAHYLIMRLPGLMPVDRELAFRIRLEASRFVSSH